MNWQTSGKKRLSKMRKNRGKFFAGQGGGASNNRPQVNFIPTSYGLGTRSADVVSPYISSCRCYGGRFKQQLAGCQQCGIAHAPSAVSAPCSYVGKVKLRSQLNLLSYNDPHHELSVVVDNRAETRRSGPAAPAAGCPGGRGVAAQDPQFAVNEHPTHLHSTSIGRQLHEPANTGEVPQIQFWNEGMAVWPDAPQSSSFGHHIDQANSSQVNSSSSSSSSSFSQLDPARQKHDEGLDDTELQQLLEGLPAGEAILMFDQLRRDARQNGEYALEDRIGFAITRYERKRCEEQGLKEDQLPTPLDKAPPQHPGPTAQALLASAEKADLDEAESWGLFEGALSSQLPFNPNPTGTVLCSAGPPPFPAQAPSLPIKMPSSPDLTAQGISDTGVACCKRAVEHNKAGASSTATPPSGDGIATALRRVVTSVPPAEIVNSPANAELSSSVNLGDAHDYTSPSFGMTGQIFHGPDAKAAGGGTSKSSSSTDHEVALALAASENEQETEVVRNQPSPGSSTQLHVKEGHQQLSGGDVMPSNAGATSNSSNPSGLEQPSACVPTPSESIQSEIGTTSADLAGTVRTSTPKLSVQNEDTPALSVEMDEAEPGIPVDHNSNRQRVTPPKNSDIPRAALKVPPSASESHKKHKRGRWQNSPFQRVPAAKARSGADCVLVRASPRRSIPFDYPHGAPSSTCPCCGEKQSNQQVNAHDDLMSTNIWLHTINLCLMQGD
jgi:hypothetical protein